MCSCHGTNNSMNYYYDRCTPSYNRNSNCNDNNSWWWIIIIIAVVIICWWD